ncbi:LAMI_0D08614g1_1 [Lachancea mirantina]|uniref:LAMI_0D08614g1_1 n=1 Tax=Lachancea mirantina TaxID=1230905 RepID=A0A1G4JDE0_9SACH|nr:LAMI_0D08614g1_1 [Lachancea mirantina]
MRAATRVNVTNKLFFTTFLVAFSSVALGSFLPCPAHAVDSDAPAHQDSRDPRDPRDPRNLRDKRHEALHKRNT